MGVWQGCKIFVKCSTGLNCPCHNARGGFIHFVDSTHVNGLAPIGFDLLDYVAIAIVEKLGGLPAQSQVRFFQDIALLSVKI